MSGLKIAVDGIANTRALIRRLAEAEEKAGKRLVKKAASDVQRRAMRTVPVDTGNLKRSILVDVADDGKSATVTATADYAAYVEYGTRKMSARPFMRPAAEEVAREMGIACDAAEREIVQEVT